MIEACIDATLPRATGIRSSSSTSRRSRPACGSASTAAIAQVLDHGQLHHGARGRGARAPARRRAGAKHAISCANGTDALALALMALGVGPGDAVLVPAFTFAATAEVVPWLGATPVFVDVLEDTLNLDPASLEQGVATPGGWA